MVEETANSDYSTENCQGIHDEKHRMLSAWLGDEKAQRDYQGTKQNRDGSYADSNVAWATAKSNEAFVGHGRLERCLTTKLSGRARRPFAMTQRATMVHGPLQRVVRHQCFPSLR